MITLAISLVSSWSGEVGGFSSRDTECLLRRSLQVESEDVNFSGKLKIRLSSLNPDTKRQSKLDQLLLVSKDPNVGGSGSLSFLWDQMRPNQVTILWSQIGNILCWPGFWDIDLSYFAKINFIVSEDPWLPTPEQYKFKF